MMTRRLVRRRRAGLADVGHAGVEVALLAGEPLVDDVGHLVRDAPPARVGRVEAQAAELLAREHVPQAELDREVAAPAPWTMPVTRAWALICRQSGKRGISRISSGRLDVGLPVDGLEQARVVEVGLDHLGDGEAALGVRRRVARERAHRDRHRLGRAAADVHAELGAGGSGRQEGARRSERGAAGGQQETPAVEGRAGDHPVMALFGSNVTIMSRQSV
jgi:hypothetical protein